MDSQGAIWVDIYDYTGFGMAADLLVKLGVNVARQLISLFANGENIILRQIAIFEMDDPIGYI